MNNVQSKKKITIVFTTIFVVLVFVSLFLIFYKKNTITSSHDIVKTTSKRTIQKTDTVLKKKWRVLLSKQDVNVNIAVYNHETKQTTFYNSDNNGVYYSASIIKVSILTNLLKQHETNNTTLSETEDSLAQQMIEESSNDAATALLTTYEGGFSAPDSLFVDLNMSQSQMNTSAWGLTTTTASDQVKLLNSLAYGITPVIDADDRSYILNLMANVDPSQNWGVGTGIDSDATVELKNGWLDYNNSWIVNSIGHITTSDSNYTIAVLTYGNLSEQDGINLIQKLAKLTFQKIEND